MKKNKTKQEIDRTNLVNVSASYIFDNFADVNGFVTLKDLELCGWTKSRAECEGLIIKDSYVPYYEEGLKVGKKIKHR